MEKKPQKSQKKAILRQKIESEEGELGPSSNHRAVGYIRVSHQEQVAEGVSLEAQAEKIHQYCSLHDFNCVAIESDEGISGKSIKARPGIQAVLDRVEKKDVEAVIVLKIDRLARNTMEALEISRFFDKKGASLHSIQERIDTKSATGEFFFTLLASLAQMERKLIGERTRSSLRFLRNSSKRYNAHPLYGYRHEGGRLVQVIEEQKVIKTVLKLNRSGQRVAQICRSLSSMGYSPRCGKEHWHFSVVKKIIEDSPIRQEINAVLMAETV